MKLTSLLTSALYLVPVVLAQQYNVTYNAFYNDGDSSLSFTACSRLIPSMHVNLCIPYHTLTRTDLS